MVLGTCWDITSEYIWKLASSSIHYHKEDSTMPTRPFQVLEEHIPNVEILLQYHMTPKAVGFERDLEQKEFCSRFTHGVSSFVIWAIQSNRPKRPCT